MLHTLKSRLRYLTFIGS